MLPRDLIIYRRQKILNRVIPCSVLVLIFAVVLIIWGNTIFHTENKAFQISCYIAVMLLPFIFTGVPHKLIDRTYCGIVEKVDIITSTDNDSSVKPTRENLYLKSTIYLSVETPSGKTIYKKACSGIAGLQQNLDTYQKGDTVFHLYGTNTVIVLPNTTDTVVHCAVCGTSNDIENIYCRDCQHSLIKHI